jgi:ABC-type transport system substrate-binding protein
MNNKNNIIYLFLIVIVSCLIILIGCSYEDLGLISSDTIETESAISGDSNEIQLSEEELFLEMKARQDKNPLSNINIRKAIFHAVDRERIINELFGGYSSVPESLFAKDSVCWYPAWSEYDYDLDIAGQYLGKAGYGPDNPLYLTISAVDNSDSKKIIEEIIREDLEKIGINLWIFNKTPKEFYQDYVYTGTYDLGLWSMYIFGKNELYYNFSSNKIPSMETEENKNCENFYWYANKNIDSLLEQLQNLEDIERVKEKTAEVQNILAGDAVILPLFSRLFVFAYSDKIKELNINTIGDRAFYNIENWKLSPDIDVPEGEKSGIIIGYESDHIDIFNGFALYSINDLLFRGLWKKNGDGSYEPELLESFIGFGNELTEIPSNEITVMLKEDIYWDDGSPVISGDIKYTYEYFIDFMEGKEYFSELDKDYRKIKEIEIIDERNFKIIFDEIVPDWQKLFSMVFKKDHFELRNLDNFSYTWIISNGPYKIIEYDPDGRMVMEVNEYYHNDLPEIERLVIRFDPDKNNLIAMLREGEIDCMSIPVDPELMKTLEENNDINLFIKSGNLIEHLALSLKPKEE